MAENYSEVPQKSVPPPASPIITGPSARPPDPFTNSVGENGPKGASDDSKKLFEIARDDNISCSGSAVSEPYSSVPPPPGQFWGGGHRASGGGQRHWGGSHHHPPVVVSGHGGGANHHQGYHRGMSAASEPTYPSRPIVEDPEVLHLPSGMRRTPSTLGREGEYIAPRSHRGKRMGVFTSGGDSQVEIPEETKQIMRQRVESIVPEIGREGSMVMPKSQVGKCMAVFTSGGDSQGMNAAVRAVACENLLKHNITNMVCIGGDGSLTGANQFRQEWPSLLEELVKTGRVPPEKQQECPNINIVGLVGSIDNDFCGTDMTIGTDTALHRIVEAVDAVVSTAHSHRRSFVIEVMGRHCGYLALVAALAAEAEWVFIPEWPPPTNWPELLCRKISEERQQGQRLNILIVAEGAIDQEGNIITSEQVKNVVKDRLHYDTRVTVLGHVQRGGFPSAYDRLLGCRMGAEAVLALMEMSPETEPCVVSIDGNQIVRVPLMQCVERTKAVQKAMDDKNWELAVKLRGRSFQRNLDTYRLLTKLHIPKKGTADFNLSGGYSFNVAVMNIGSPACGMNATVRSFARMALYHNCKVYGIQNSFEGLMHGDLKLLTWNDVTNWSMYGGSFLGTQKQLPIHTMGRVAEQFRKHRIHGLLLVGGFEAFHSALLLAEQRDKYPEFCIPIVVIAATISNNVPGTRNFIIHLLSHHGFNEVCTRILKLPMPGLARRVVTSLWPKQTGLIFL